MALLLLSEIGIATVSILGRCRLPRPVELVGLQLPGVVEGDGGVGSSLLFQATVIFIVTPVHGPIPVKRTAAAVVMVIYAGTLKVKMGKMGAGQLLTLDTTKSRSLLSSAKS